MPAVPVRIGFSLREQRIVDAESAEMRARYGDAARDPKDEPFECFADDADDAQDLVDERLALVGVERRRFLTEIAGEIALDFSTTTPAVDLIDDERHADLRCAVVAITEDAGSGKLSLGIWG